MVAQGALAQNSHEAMAHHEMPTRILVEQRVGAYIASVWSSRDVGMGAVYVVLDAADGASFVAPSRVRVAVAPASGRLPEVVHDAHVDNAQHAERYTAHVMFDRADSWNVRVIVESAAGGGELTSHVDTAPNAMNGLFGLVLSSLPFVLIAGVWWRAAVVRQARRFPGESIAGPTL